MRRFLGRVLMGKPENRNKTAKDWAFMVNAIGLSFMLLAVIVEFAPYIEDIGNPNLKEIQQVESQVKHILPRTIPAMLQEGGGKPVMLVFYASWCMYCAKEVPAIIDMMENGDLNMVKPVFISMDAQPRIYSKYLVKTQYYKHIEPIMLQEQIYSNIKPVMASTGSHFNGAVPYVGFFNSQGKMVAELIGLVDKQHLLEVAQKASESATPN